MLEYLHLLADLLRALVRARADLVTENLLLRQQLVILSRPTRRRPPLRRRDKIFWMLVRVIRHDWRRHLLVVGPATVVRWHRGGGWLVWRWQARPGTGLPRIDAEIRALI